MILQESWTFPVRQPLQEKPRTHGTPRTTATELSCQATELIACHLALPRLAVRTHLSCQLSWEPNMVDNQELASCNHGALPTGSTSAITTTSTTQVVRRRAQSPLQAVRHDDNETGYPGYKISLGPAGSPPFGTRGEPFHSAFMASKHSEAPSIQDQTGLTCRLISAHAAVTSSSLSTAPTR